jgi:hypothetical protein
MNKRGATFVATSVSLIVLWLGLAAVLHELFRLNKTDGSVFFVEGMATLTAIAMWFVKTDRWGWEGSAGEWLGLFLVSLPISVLFVEIDCGGTLHFADGVLTCAQYGGGIFIVFTIGSLATTAVALPSALRAWLLDKLESRTKPKAL